MVPDDPGAVTAPLLRWAALRLLVALALIVTALGILVYALAATAVDITPFPLPAALLLLLCTPLAAGAIAGGTWARGGRWRRAEQLSVLGVLAFALVLGLRGLVLGIDGLLERDVVGTSTEELGFWFAQATAALASIAAVIACVPLPLGRRAAWGVLAGAAAVVLACGTATAVVSQGADGCDGFQLDGERWRAAVRGDGSDDGERMARAIARCGSLDGLTRAEVRALLGPPHEREASSWSWTAGWEYALVGTSAVTLTADLRGDRVVDVTVPEPVD